MRFVPSFSLDRAMVGGAEDLEQHRVHVPQEDRILDEGLHLRRREPLRPGTQRQVDTGQSGRLAVPAPHLDEAPQRPLQPAMPADIDDHGGAGADHALLPQIAERRLPPMQRRGAQRIRDLRIGKQRRAERVNANETAGLRD